MSTSWSHKIADLRSHAFRAYSEFALDPCRVARLDEMAALVDLYINFIYMYEWIHHPDVVATDEIINWTFIDVASDLSHALWSLASGYHKASASSLRNAYELTAIALTFQIEENRSSRVGAYNELFSKWDAGLLGTPNWSRLLSYFEHNANFVNFGTEHNLKPRDLFYGHYSSLCSFTHSRPFDPLLKIPSNTMNMGPNTPFFDLRLFEVGFSLFKRTISLGAAMWLLAFPEMLTSRASYSDTPSLEYSPLFEPSFGREAYTWITGVA